MKTLFVRIPYSKRLFLWLLGYSFLLVGFVVVFQYNREKEFKAEEMNDRLQLVNAYVLTELSDGVRPSQIRLDEFTPMSGIRLSIIADDGKVLYDNSMDKLPDTNHRDRAEIKQALDSGSGFTVRRHSDTTGTNYFYSATRGDNGIIVRTAVPYSVSLMTLLKADYGFLRIIGIIAIAMCVLGYFATRRLGQHIMRLSRFAERVESGATISETEPFPNDELGHISNHIVRLYVRLQQANAARDAEHRAALREQMDKERIKKQLTNNISHELKTPVASVRLCLETLLRHPELDDERRRNFLNRALSNTDRLQNLLADVALITRMDEGGESIVTGPVDLAGIIAEVADDRRLLAAGHGMTILNNVAAPLTMTGNQSLLMAIFNNLIDNAIMHSGGKTVTISADTVTPERIVLTLADDGSGVGDEHLSRIFERFYRIDKGRSRAAGGTGLGLSIVRNAVLMHGGSITASNRRSGGLVFRITLMREGALQRPLTNH